jgi:hypothetical protein
MGRHSKYNEEIANEICLAIACCSKGLRQLCKEHEYWPSRKSIYEWLKKYPKFRDQYARAKEHQVEALMDEILEIADDTSEDYVMNDEGKLVCNHEHIQRSRVRIDTRKWIASKLCPRVYGDKNKDESYTAQDFMLQLLNLGKDKRNDE